MKISTAILKELNACESGFDAFAKVHMDKEILFSECVKSESNSISDYFWFIRRQSLNDAHKKDLQLLAIEFAERVLPVFESKYPDDKRPRAAVEMAKLYLSGESTLDALKEARRAAADAAADAAAYAAADAVYADAAYAAADAAAYAAAYAVAAYADAAYAAADAVADAAAYAVAAYADAAYAAADAVADAAAYAVAAYAAADAVADAAAYAVAAYAYAYAYAAADERSWQKQRLAELMVKWGW